MSHFIEHYAFPLSAACAVVSILLCAIGAALLPRSRD